MKKYISRFHFITRDDARYSHAEQSLMACQSGINWIQYRCLSKPDKELIDEINQVAAICDDWGATLILTGNYHLLDKVDAQGVHIEDMDADLGAIRDIITGEKTLGASAVSVDRILTLQQAGFADYCGYGPFAHTDTKPNDFPLLGFKAYRDLERQPLTMPIIAVGGIQLADAGTLMQTSVTGIAVCGAIINAAHPQQMMKAFYQAV